MGIAVARQRTDVPRPSEEHRVPEPAAPSVPPAVPPTVPPTVPPAVPAASHWPLPPTAGLPSHPHPFWLTQGQFPGNLTDLYLNMPFWCPFKLLFCLPSAFLQHPSPSSHPAPPPQGLGWRAPWATSSAETLSPGTTTCFPTHALCRVRQGDKASDDTHYTRLFLVLYFYNRRKST